MEKVTIILSLVFFFFPGSHCASVDNFAEQTGKEATDEASALMSQYWNWRLQEAPEFASKNGLSKYDDQLEEFTEEAFRRREANATAMLASIEKINVKLLSHTDRVSIAVMEDMLTTFVAGFPYRKMSAYIPFRSNTNRFVVVWEGLQDITRHDTIEGYENLLARYSAIAVQVDQQINLTREAIKLGYSGTRVGLTEPMSLTDDYIKDLGMQLSKPFRDIPDSIANGTSRENMKNRVTEIITEKLVPSVRKIHRFFTEEYYPKTISEVGVSALPGGRDFYEACLRWHLSVNMTAQQVHALGLQEVERIHRQMQKIKDDDGFQGDVREYIAHLKNQSSNMYSSSEEMMENIREIIKKIKIRLPDILLHIPSTPFVIEECPDKRGPLGSYGRAPLDRSRPASYYVNTLLPQTRARFNTLPVVLHEAEPGHHVQASYVDEEALPLFRRLPDHSKPYAAPFKWPVYTAYSEGWGLYSEYLGEEMNLYEHPYQLLGRYSGEMLRACRMVVDTGIHAFGWSQERAEAYIGNYTAIAPDLVRSEVLRYISWPGQACAYKIGELKIKELRRMAETKLGDLFDLREFHDRILGLGPVPLSILEDVILTWIETENPQKVSSAGAKETLTGCALATLQIVCVTLALLR